ncbi:MAG TPA: class I lanthipeptide [Thermoanaerobaculia bacterium]|nr:class I lanthipeptide [Thermoanaerobaculia bacterium]
MKKWSKKLRLTKETLVNLEASRLENVLGAVATERSVCVTICATNCTTCATDGRACGVSTFC